MKTLIYIGLFHFLIANSNALRRCEVDGYVQLGDKCYKTVLQTGLNYREAETACEVDGGHLAVMTNAKEAIAVLSSIAQKATWRTLRPYHRLWIGLNDKEKENEYVFEDGTKLSDAEINLFPKGEGNNDPVKWDDCAQVQQYMQWLHRPCRDTTTKGYVCETAALGEPNELNACPEKGGWEQIGNKCFHAKKSMSSTKWFKAQGLCQKKHPQASLAKIESWEDIYSVYSIMQEAGFSSKDLAWFGATDFLNEGSFLFPDGTDAKPIGGSHVFTSGRSVDDFGMVKLGKWVTTLWNIGNPAGYICSIDLDGLHSPVSTWMQVEFSHSFSGTNAQDDVTTLDTCLEDCGNADPNVCSFLTHYSNNYCNSLTAEEQEAASEIPYTYSYRNFQRRVGGACGSNEIEEVSGIFLNPKTSGIAEIVAGVSAEECKRILDDTSAYTAVAYRASNGRCIIYTEAPSVFSSSYQITNAGVYVLYYKSKCQKCAFEYDCRDGWTKVGDYCVKSFEEEASRMGAMVGCSEQEPNSVLASLREEHTAYSSLWQNLGATDELWISATSMSHTLTWTWQDNSDAPTPEKTSGAEYRYATATESGLIQQKNSFKAKGFICEYKAGSEGTQK